MALAKLKELTNKLIARPEDILWSTYKDSSFPKLVTTFDGRIIVCNQAFEDLVGYTEAELQELGWHNLTHPDDLALDTEYAEKVARGYLWYYQIRKRYMHKDGTPAWIYLNVERVDVPGHYPVAVCLAQPSEQESLKITGTRPHG